MTFVCIDISDVIKYISDRIANYDKPESMTEWCKKVIKELPFCKFQSLTCMRARLTRALRKIENLIEYSLMEKLQLVFIFSRPVSDRFVQILKDEKFEITQDDKKRIRRFSTEDGRVVKFSDHRQVYDEPRQINVKYVERRQRKSIMASNKGRIRMYRLN
ncbi:hypothetical protein B9Z55_024400 [Caenorhabditis nigoni]|uniref:SPK domain-containing protein n=1 Tax=Caenorhabditis nigoni TaxID=1611254 RepID=A0A2G5SU51_9PELO|nr:hypothetical protein B9Z55_024400 [Caenorhabditis nigoni]